MKSYSALLIVACLMSVAASAAEPSSKTHELKLAKAGEVLIADDFQQAEKANRRLTRGNWTVKSGEAACAHDDELFKKYKNHGPAIWYDQEFTDAVIRFEFQPSAECKHFVFTINGRDGHVFRFVMNEMAMDIRAWDADHRAKPLAKGEPAMPKDVWVPVTVELVGKQTAVQIGGKYQKVVEDASYAAPKTVVGVSFHYGSLRLRNFELRKAEKK